MTFGIADQIPKFYGSVTVGERGQVAIPAEARRELNIVPASKLLAFGSQNAKALVLVKVEFMAEFLKVFTGAIQSFEQVMKADGPASIRGPENSGKQARS